MTTECIRLRLQTRASACSLVVDVLDRDITKLLGSMVSEDLMHWTETFSLYVAPRKVSF